MATVYPITWPSTCAYPYVPSTWPAAAKNGTAVLCTKTYASLLDPALMIIQLCIVAAFLAVLGIFGKRFYMMRKYKKNPYETAHTKTYLQMSCAAVAGIFCAIDPEGIRGFYPSTLYFIADEFVAATYFCVIVWFADMFLYVISYSHVHTFTTLSHVRLLL